MDVEHDLFIPKIVDIPYFLVKQFQMRIEWRWESYDISCWEHEKIYFSCIFQLPFALFQERSFVHFSSFSVKQV